MKNHLIKINFTGGLISPGELQVILSAVQCVGVTEVRFGLRQVLWFEVSPQHHMLDHCFNLLKENKIFFEIDADECPNIISSYPAQEVFIQRNWLSEGIYKDIFDSFTHKPRLKVNIADSEQSFTPILTGHINWVASKQAHYWYLIIRFPKTNRTYTWTHWVDTSDIARVSKKIEQLILGQAHLFVANPFANGDLLFEWLLKGDQFNTIPVSESLQLPTFMLPYYEGFNRYDDKLWLGIYRRNEQFSVAFLQDLCILCLNTKVGLLCSTSWKSIIIKNIEPRDRNYWDLLLAKHQINVRHAANELNFQIEDHAPDALALKNELVNHLAKTDTRTFGVCIGIKTLEIGEVFCSILIHRRALHWAGIRLRYVYDILLAEEFNPNKRTAEIFVQGVSRRKLSEYLHSAIMKYYHTKSVLDREQAHASAVEKSQSAIKSDGEKIVQQCPNCWSVYDETVGIPHLHIPAYTSFDMLPSMYKCECCETPKNQFRSVKQVLLFA